MKRFRVYAQVVGSKYLGEFEAETEEEAIEKAAEDADVSLCWSCVAECEDAEVCEIHASEVKS